MGLFKWSLYQNFCLCYKSSLILHASIPKWLSMKMFIEGFTMVWYYRQGCDGIIISFLEIYI